MPPYLDLVFQVVRVAHGVLDGSVRMCAVLAEEGVFSPRQKGQQGPQPYSPHTVSNWMRRITTPPPEVVLALARRTGQSLDSLLGINTSLQRQEELEQRMEQLAGEFRAFVQAQGKTPA